MSNFGLRRPHAAIAGNSRSSQDEYRRKWFVDSVNGNDANNGKSSLFAFATISALSAADIHANDIVCLARGSLWREQLSISVTGVDVSAYGSGAKPILDGSNVLSAGSWTKTGGQTYVYQATVSPEFWEGSGKDFINVWENNTYLVLATSVANCDATVGSYYPSALTGTITLYIHSTGHTDPRSDGKTYEFTQRRLGIEARGAERVVLENIETRKSMSKDGSTTLGKYGQARSCAFNWGNLHNILIETGCQMMNCTVAECYAGTESTAMIVYNSNTPAGEGILIKDCTVQCTTYNALAIGIYGHSNVSGSFGAVLVDGCTLSNLYGGISGIHGEIVCDGCDTSECHIPYIIYEDAYTINNAYHVDAASLTQRFVSMGAGTSLNMNDGVVQMTYATDYTGAIFTGGSGCSINLQRCSIAITQNDIAGGSCIYSEHDAAVTIKDSTLDCNNWGWAFYLTDASVTVEADRNHYVDSDTRFHYRGTTYANLAAWQAASGQDENSTAG